MDHDEWLELVSAEADGELSAAESDQLADHLAGCPSCAAQLAGFEAVRRRTRMRTASTGDHLLDDVLAARDRQVTSAAAARSVLLRRGGVAVAAIAAAIAGLVLLSPGSTTAPLQAPGANDALIAAQDRSFDDADIEIETGTTVEWRNAGTITHHLVRKLGAATVDEDLPPGRTETATFEQPGTFEFYCAIHPEMTGTVTVDT